MIKIFTLLISFTILFNGAFAQNQNVYYIGANGTHVSTADSAEFTEVISVLDSVTMLFDVRQYYKNGKIKFIGKSLSNQIALLDGPYISYYPTGKKQQIATYKNNIAVGDVYDYYPNGVLYRVKFFELPVLEHEYTVDGEKAGFNVKTLQDSTGKVIFSDDNGYYIDYYPDFKGVYEEGTLIKGKRDGEWKGNGKKTDSITAFKEHYLKGKILDGIAEFIDGKSYSYKTRYIAAQYQGGPEALERYISSTARFPPSDVIKNIEGVVLLQIKINYDGKVSDIKSIYSPSEKMSEESIRVLNTTVANWKPPIIFGRKMNTLVGVRIKFILQSNSNNTTVYIIKHVL